MAILSIVMNLIFQVVSPIIMLTFITLNTLVFETHFIQGLEVKKQASNYLQS